MVKSSRLYSNFNSQDEMVVEEVGACPVVEEVGACSDPCKPSLE